MQRSKVKLEGFARTVSNMNKPMVLVMLYEYLFGHGMLERIYPGFFGKELQE